MQRYFYWRVVVINAVGVGGGDVVLDVGVYVLLLVKSWDWGRESLGEEVTAPIGSSLALLAERSEAWCLLLLLLCLPLSRLFQQKVDP